MPWIAARVLGTEIVRSRGGEGAVTLTGARIPTDGGLTVANRKMNSSHRRSGGRAHPGKGEAAKRGRTPESPASMRRPGESMMREASEMISGSAETVRELQRETGKGMAKAMDLTKTASLAPFQVASAWGKVWQAWMRSVSGM